MGVIHSSAWFKHQLSLTTPLLSLPTTHRDVSPLLQREADLNFRRGPGHSSSAGSSSTTTVTSSSAASSAASSAGSGGGGGDGGSSGGGALARSGLGTFFTAHVQPDPMEFLPVQYALLPAALGGGASERPDGAGGSGIGGGGGGGGGGIGYVKIVAFSASAPDQLDRALGEIFGPADAGVRGLILDLRDNPGGDVRAGVEAARDFLRDGDMLAV